MSPTLLPPGLAEEFSRARNIGALLNIVLPFVGALILIIFVASPGALRNPPGEETLWLAYALLAFSVTTCIVARTIHQRLMEHLVGLIRTERYRPGRLTFAYMVLFVLYLMPTLWGFALYLLTGDMLTGGILGAITVVAHLFLTPHFTLFFRR